MVGFCIQILKDSEPSEHEYSILAPISSPMMSLCKIGIDWTLLVITV